MAVPPTWKVFCCFGIHSLISATSHCVYFLLIDDELFVLENITVLDYGMSASPVSTACLVVRMNCCDLFTLLYSVVTMEAHRLLRVENCVLNTLPRNQWLQHCKEFILSDRNSQKFTFRFKKMVFRLTDYDVIGFDLDMTLCRYRKFTVISDVDLDSFQTVSTSGST